MPLPRRPQRKSPPLPLRDTRGTRARRRQRLANPDRVTALSDGGFAIVRTILVLEVAAPQGLSGQSLRTALDGLRPTLTA